MKMIHFAAGFLMFAPPAFAQANLPAGNYAIEGAVTANNSSVCPLATNRPVSGHLYYPGIGSDATQMTLESIVPGKSITLAYMNAFAPVPTGGLNGWSGANFAAPNYSQFMNAKLVGGGTSAYLDFALTNVLAVPAGITVAQGTLSLNTDSIAPCQETIQAVFTRVAPYEKPTY